jgi:hypothetical protein
MKGNAKNIYKICILWTLTGICIVTILSGYFSASSAEDSAEVQHITS